jgi:hypothetical protein
VECVWVYETAGLDAEGRVIIDSDRRTLVRLDTGEPVRHERIPEEDRQLSLFPEEPDAVNEEPVPDDSAEFADLADDPDEFAEEAAQEAPKTSNAPSKRGGKLFKFSRLGLMGKPSAVLRKTPQRRMRCSGTLKTACQS